MASPAAETMQNGISTPPATATAPTLSPPTQSQPQPSQPTAQSQPQTNGTPTTAPMNPAFPPNSLSDPGTSKRPRDARLIHLILANMGVHAYTERVPLQLLDFAYRYTSSILSDAFSYEPPLPTTSSTKKRGANTDGTGEDGISINALRTAVGARAAGAFNTSLGKEFMSEVAQERNRIALPRVEREFGVRLPPERYCFTGVGWGVKGAWEEEIEEVDADEDMDLDGEGVGAFGGGPVGTVNGTTAVNGNGENKDGEGKDVDMGGMDEEEEEQDDDEFEEAMGINREINA